MKTKLEMAHEYAIALINSDCEMQFDKFIQLCWNYADAMQAEADERQTRKNEHDAEANRKIMDALANPMRCVRQQEWKPNWGELPSNANYFAMDKSGMCNAYENKPEICDDQWDFGDAICECDSFGYQGDWRDSLRKRPE